MSNIDFKNIRYILHKMKYIMSIIILSVLEISGVGYLTYWREEFWGFVANKDGDNFWLYIGYFSLVAISLTIVVSLCNYIIQIYGISMRNGLVKKSLIIKEDHVNTEGIEQRIQQDTLEYPILLISLIKSILTSIVYLIFYSYVIISSVGMVYLIIPIIYSSISTILGFSIAKPLIKLNYLQQVKEAAFRMCLRFDMYVQASNINKELARKTKHLTYFTYLFNQVSVIFPYMMLAGIYFGGKITFGVLMQISSAIIHFNECASIVLNSFGDINRLLSCRKRLKEIKII